MLEAKQRYYISSAVVVAKPAALDAVRSTLETMDNVEVFAVQDGKIVLVIEGRTSGQLGAKLSEISGIPGVVAANMVFEHSEDEEA
jgi:nitrate reductase NapD